VAAADAPILAGMRCPACGHLGLRYVPFTRVIREADPLTDLPRTRLSHRAFGRCPRCGASIEWEPYAAGRRDRRKRGTSA
jgi:hypothetical protein